MVPTGMPGDTIEFSFDEPLRGVLLYIRDFDVSSKAIVSSQGATGTVLIAGSADLSYNPQTGLLTTSYTGWTGDFGNGVIQFLGDVESVRMDWSGGTGNNGVFYTVGLLPELPGDLNRDGLVGSPDLDIVREHWNETVPPGDLSMGDASGDGFVGSSDLDTVRANWGESLFAAAVPEPGMGILMLLGATMAVLLRRNWGL